MEKEINEKQEALSTEHYAFENYRRDAEDKIVQLQEERDRRVREVSEHFQMEITEREIRMENLEAQIVKLQHFEEREEQYKQRIVELELMVKEKEYAHHDEMRKLEKNFFKQTQNLDNVNRAKIEDIQRNADKIAEQKVKDQEESIKRENKKLRQELEVYQRELDQVRRERSSLMEENRSQRKNMSINQEGAMEYQTVNHQQAVKIRRLKEKVDYLKNYISEEVTKYTKDIEFLKYQNAAKVQENEHQIRSLKEQLSVRSRELKNVKALASMILDQRSEIEKFFLSALDQVLLMSDNKYNIIGEGGDTKETEE